MSQIKLLHSGGNGVIVAAPASNPASDITFKLPQADGSANEFLKTDGSGNLSFSAVTATSKRTIGSTITLSNQSNVDFTGFSSSITRFEIHVNALSCSGDNNWGVRIGTGGSVDTSGYVAQAGYFGDSSSNQRGQVSHSSGFYTHGLAAASYSNNGIFRFFRIASTENKWYCRTDLEEYNNPNFWWYINGYRNLSGAIDIIRLLPIAGTFDSGHLRLVTYAD